MVLIFKFTNNVSELNNTKLVAASFLFQDLESRRKKNWKINVTMAGVFVKSACSSKDILLRVRWKGKYILININI